MNIEQYLLQNTFGKSMKSTYCIFLLLITYLLSNTFAYSQSGITNISGKIHGYEVPTDTNTIYQNKIYFQFKKPDQKEFNDSCKIDSLGNFNKTFSLSGFNYLNITGAIFFKTIVEAGKDFHAEIKETTTTTGGETGDLYYQLSNNIQDGWSDIGIREISLKDSIHYNAIILENLVKIRNLIKTEKLPPEFQRELYYYNEYEYAIAYMQYAENKRKSETFKQFNFVSKNYLEPIKELLNNKENLIECDYLKSQLIETCDSLKK